MKPLSSITFIKGNIKKTLPSFICTMISVFLVFFFGLIMYGSVDDFSKADKNMLKSVTIIYTNDSNKPISDKISEKIKNDSNVSKVIPFLGMKNSFNYHAVFGNAGGINSIIVYSNDVNTILKNLSLKLVSGRIPKNNAREMMLPIEFIKQYNLKLGQYINSNTNPDMYTKKTYKIVGITKGDSFLPIVCDVGKIKKADAEKLGMMFFFKNSDNKKLNNRIMRLKDENIGIIEYKSVKEEMDQTLSSLDFLYVSLSSIILIVVCISLGNLNYIVFINRKNEISVLNAIGFSKSKLQRKLFYENAIVYFAGYIMGIGFTLFVTYLLNVAVWQPTGKHVPIFRPSTMLVALIIPLVVSLFSIISTIKEFNKLGYENLNI